MEVIFDPQNALNVLMQFQGCPNIERIENPPHFWRLGRVFLEHDYQWLTQGRRPIHPMFQPPEQRRR
jgi:hypothetical protein